MLNKGFLKPRISVNTLGKRDFWTGVTIGIAMSIVLSYFFNYSREALRFITFYRNPYIPDNEVFKLNDLFFAALSASLGFGFTIIYWLRGQRKSIKRKYLKTLTLSNAWLIIWVSIMIVSRFGSILPIILYGLYGYDNELDLLEEFWLLFLLAPAHIFLSHWATLRLIFRTRYWVLVSCLFCSMIAFGLFKTTSANRAPLNRVHYLLNKERFDYIENEFRNAREKGVLLSDTLKQKLQKRHAKGTMELVSNLKMAFKGNKIVSPNTLILEKILIHNMYSHSIYWRHDTLATDTNWSYALPEEVYAQILKHDPESYETELLFEILYEQASLFSSPELKWDTIEQYSDYERDRYFHQMQLLERTTTIRSKLIQVLNKLRANKTYGKYHDLLPELEPLTDRRNQKDYQLELPDI